MTWITSDLPFRTMQFADNCSERLTISENSSLSVGLGLLSCRLSNLTRKNRGRAPLEATTP